MTEGIINTNIYLCFRKRGLIIYCQRNLGSRVQRGKEDDNNKDP